MPTLMDVLGLLPVYETEVATAPDEPFGVNDVLFDELTANVPAIASTGLMVKLPLNGPVMVIVPVVSTVVFEVRVIAPENVTSASEAGGLPEALQTPNEPIAPKDVVPPPMLIAWATVAPFKAQKKSPPFEAVIVLLEVPNEDPLYAYTCAPLAIVVPPVQPGLASYK